MAIAESLQLPFPAAIPSHQFLLHICPARLPWETGTASPSVANAAPSVSVPEVDKALPAWASSQKTFIQGLRPFHQCLCDWNNSIQSIRNVLIHVEDSIRFPQDLGSPSRTCISIMVKTCKDCMRLSLLDSRIALRYHFPALLGTVQVEDVRQVSRQGLVT